MKLKYYLRGMGVGILFATIILSVSFRVSSKVRLSDDEIIKRAEELGMVKQSDVNLDDIIKPSVTPTVTPEKDSPVSPTAQPTATPTAEPAGEPTTKPTDKPTGTKEVKPTESPGDVTFRIVPGMTSEDVSNLLKDKGIIEDAKAFNQYLKINNYTTDINIGEYQIKKFSSYEDIADTIITK